MRCESASPEIADISVERVAVKATTSEEARLHRPQGRHRRDGDGDRPPALDLVTGFFRWPTRQTQAAAIALLDLCKAGS
jgi:hypothetical protein